MDLLEGKHAFVHDGNADGRGRGTARAVRDAEVDLGRLAGLVGVALELDAHLERVGRIDIEQARVSDEVRAGREHIRLQRHGARHGRIDVERDRGATGFEIDRLRQHGLALADHVEVDRPLGFRGEHVGAQGLANLAQRLIRPQDQVLARGLGGQLDRFLGTASLAVPGAQGEVHVALLRRREG